MRRKHWAVIALAFIALYSLVFCAPVRGASVHYPIRLAIPPPSYAAWQMRDDSWWNIKPRHTHAGLPRLGTLRSGYAYLDGMPVRKDVALALQTGQLRGLYRAMTYRFYVGGIAWRPVFGGDTVLPRQGAIIVGIRADF